MLSVESRKVTKDIKIEISRRPKDFYLNDERYNRYQELVAGFLEEGLSKIDFSTMENRIRVKRVQISIRQAKSRAFTALKEEIRGR